uniref:Autophagy-related protein 16-1 n=1 Tax=Phallusia mammillata TaxID=59560 RepID=A0A6F9D7V5_9ASCI|nr:autophagy-related protein 16-1 [Phallusia mammillata]
MEENDKLDHENIVLQQIIARNKTYAKFATLINSYSQLSGANQELQKTNESLHSDIEKLKQENHDLSSKAHAGIVSAEKNEQFSVLEQKLFRVQEELTEVHRTKGARAQQILDLNVALQEKEREISTFNQQLQTKADENTVLETNCENLKQKNADLEQAIQTVKDNYQALQILSDSFEEKLRKSQDEYNQLLERYKKLNEKHIAVLNTENDTFKRKGDDKSRSASVDIVPQMKLNPASPTPTTPTSATGESTIGNTVKKMFSDLFSVKSRTPSDEDRDCSHSLGNYGYSADVRLPQEVVCKWDAHESEVMAVKFSASGGILATGGSDRLIHIWNFFGDKSRLQHTLRGSNGSITNIDFDPMERLLAGSSNDYATRIWDLGTQRLKLNLTGHGGRVSAARFLGSAYRLASGSQDRTVKVWDVRSGACTRTFMAGSSCNDIVAAYAADCLASGHFDRKIRVWDARVSGHAQNEIVVGGRVTSLDMPADHTSLVCCTKDHTLEVVDIRKSAVSKVFSHDQFKVLTDQTRCAYSVDGEYVAVGSGDGTVLAWNVKTGELVSTAKHHNHPVISCSWSGGRLVTGDKHKKCVLWTGT